MDYNKFKDHFSQFGMIIDSNLMMDRETGLHRGFGFVTFDDAGATQTALSQDHYLDGQQVSHLFGGLYAIMDRACYKVKRANVPLSSTFS